MLNEIKEYEQYIMNFDETKRIEDFRLKYSRFVKKDFSGVERALTSIARGYIFNHNRPFNEKFTKEALKAWCGFDFDETTPDIGCYKNWVPQYIMHMIHLYVEDCINVLAMHDKDGMINMLDATLHDLRDCDVISNLGNKIEDIKSFESVVKNYPYLKKKQLHVKLGQIAECYSKISKLNEKSELWTKSMFSYVQRESGTVKGISFEAVIADALCKGRLERYYLMCDINPFDADLIMKFNGEKLKSLSKKNLEKDKRERDRILKITATYLLQKMDKQQEYAFFNKTDTSNWLTELKQELEDADFECYKLAGTNEDIFTFNTITSITKLKLHPEWRKHFKIIKACDIEKPENRGLIFYSDFGSSRYLQEGKRYDE